MIIREPIPELSPQAKCLCAAIFWPGGDKTELTFNTPKRIGLEAKRALDELAAKKVIKMQGDPVDGPVTYTGTDLSVLIGVKVSQKFINQHGRFPMVIDFPEDMPVFIVAKSFHRAKQVAKVHGLHPEGTFRHGKGAWRYINEPDKARGIEFGKADVIWDETMWDLPDIDTVIQIMVTRGAPSPF
jgi:hypothetical protein